MHELPLHRQNVDLRELLTLSLLAHTAAATAAQITLFPPPAGDPIMLKIDPERITQVIDNILNNAISYAGTGTNITVILSQRSKCQTGNYR